MSFKTHDGLFEDLYIRPRALMLFSGEARYRWLHTIAMRKID